MNNVDVKKLMNAQEEAFSFPDGTYVEQGELVWKDGELQQHSVRRSKLIFDMYKKNPEKYMVYYQKELEKPIGLSKKFEIKYLYHIFAQSVNLSFASDMGRPGKSAAIRREFDKRDMELKCQLAEKQREVNRREDQYERFMHDSARTNRERYETGSMGSGAYHEESSAREYRTYLDTRKEREAIERNERAMHYYWAQAVGEEQASRRKTIQTNERIRMMPVAEIVFDAEEPVAIILYKGQQEVREIESAEPIDLEYMEGSLLVNKVMMHRTIHYKPLFDYISRRYGIGIPE